MAEHIENVKINYSLTGLNTATAKVRNFDRANRQMITEVKKWDKVHGWRTQSVQLNEMQGSMQKAGGAVKGLALRFVGLQAAMSYGLQKGRELIKWVQDSIQEFRAFEKNMAEVSTIIMDLSRGAVADLTAGITNLSIKFGKSVNDLSRGMYDILSAAIPAGDALRLLEVSSEAATAGLTDVETSVDVFTSILNAWGLSVSQATMISDELFQTVVRGKLRFEELASAMGYIAPIAANLGVEFKEVAAALSTVTRQGQRVDMATRGLALGIQNIADLTPKAAEAATKYGVDLSATALRVGGLNYVLTELNEAMNEHGTKILPEMISNMRSLRVFMALAGDEGIDGFRKDLDLLNTSAGRTEQAMNRMMQTSQFAADVLAQQMKVLERSIGEAWSGFDLWIKKSKLWWGTFLTGGDANAAVEQYENRVFEIKTQAANLLKIQSDIIKTPDITSIIGDFDSDIYKDFNSARDALSKLIGEASNFDAAKEYFTLKEEEIDWMNQIGNIGEAVTLLDGLKVRYIKIMNEFKDVEGGLSVQLPSTIKKGIVELNEEIKKLAFKPFLNIKEFGTWNEIWVSLNKNVREFDQVLANNTWQIDNFTNKLSDVQNKLSAYADAEEGIRAVIEESGKSINDHKMNIMELNMEIANLAREVEDAYTTIGGAVFEGTMQWELSITAANTQLERFSNYSKMAIQYGDEFNTTFMEGIKDIDGYTEIFKEIPDYLDYYNAAVWEATKNNTGYQGSIVDLISEMSRYSKSYEELRKETELFKNELDELNLAIRKNNLEISKIELKGMMRRRGLTRDEEKKIKKIKIENAKIRIQIVERELTDEQIALEKNVEFQKSEFDKLKEIYDEYVDRVKFDLWELKDTRNSDLEDLIININFKKDRLTDYRGFFVSELQALEDAELTYQAALMAIAADDALAESYKDLYGINALEEAQIALEDYLKQLQEIDIADIDIKKVTSGTKKKSYTPAIDYSNPVEVVKAVQKAATPRQREDIWIEGFRKSLGFQRGIQYVPETRPYMLHRGETVLPAGKETGLGNVTVNINNNVTIKSEVDAKRFAELQAEAIHMQLGNRKTGKSKYRMR